MKPFLLISALSALAFIAQPSTLADPRLVFAHYVVWNADYAKSIDGDPVKGYMRDIQEAQAAGIDGFALDLGAWSSRPYYIPNVDNMFEAAARLNTGFHLFYSADFASRELTAADVRAVLRRYLDNPRWAPYYFRYHGRPVLSTFSGDLEAGVGAENVTWWKNNLIGPLRAGTEPGDQPKTGLTPIDPFVLPTFFVRAKGAPEVPVYEDVLNAPKSSYNAWWGQVVDGLYYWGIAGIPQSPYVDARGSNQSTITSSQAYARVAHENGKLYMGLCAPQFWQCKGKTVQRRYYEYQGGIGMRAKWMSMIQVEKPELVEIVTWNDFYEATYWSPIDDPVKTGGVHAPLGFFKSHAGALELLKYYIQWYKTGRQPAIHRDTIYWFYRTHPKDAVAPNDPDGPVTGLYGPVADNIYVTCNLTAPAILTVNTGGHTQTINVPAGSTDVAVPFTPGPQTFALSRHGRTILQGTGDSIDQTIERYNFNYSTGFAQAD